MFVKPQKLGREDSWAGVRPETTLNSLKKKDCELMVCTFKSAFTLGVSCIKQSDNISALTNAQSSWLTLFVAAGDDDD